MTAQFGVAGHAISFGHLSNMRVVFTKTVMAHVPLGYDTVITHKHWSNHNVQDLGSHSCILTLKNTSLSNKIVERCMSLVEYTGINTYC